MTVATNGPHMLRTSSCPLKGRKTASKLIFPKYHASCLQTPFQGVYYYDQGGSGMRVSEVGGVAIGGGVVDRVGAGFLGRRKGQGRGNSYPGSLLCQVGSILKHKKGKRNNYSFHLSILSSVKPSILGSHITWAPGHHARAAHHP